jgi:hypothetical protein
VAIELDPAMEAAYRELASLLKNDPDTDIDQAKSRAAYRSWKLWRAASPAAKLDVQTSQAGAFLALRSSDPMVAAELDPNLGEAQFLAAQALLGIDTERAVLFARQAFAALGDRADTRALLAAVGAEPFRDVITLADIVLSEELRNSKLVGATEGVLYVLHGGSAGLVSQVAIPTGRVTRLVSGAVGPVSQSPDGQALALALQASPTHAGSTEISILNPSSRSVTSVCATLAPVIGIMWAPDGSSIAVSSGEGLCLISMSAGAEPNLRMVVPASLSDAGMRIPLILGWTTDGGALIYQWLYRDHDLLDMTGQWVGALWRYDLYSGISTLIETPYGLGVGALAHSRSGPLLACAVSTDYRQMDLHLCTLDANTLRLTASLAEGYVYAFPLSWSPDGHWLLVSVAPWANNPYDPLYPHLIRRVLSPPVDQSNSFVWAYDGTGKLSLLPIPKDADSTLCLDDGTVYYTIADDTIGGFRLR